MNKVFTGAVLGFAAMLIGVISPLATAQSVEYGPFFNTRTGVEGIGNEADFLRIRQADGTKVDTIEACSGDVTIWMYVHNDQAEVNNNNPATAGEYDGVGVAQNTRVKVSIPTATTNNHTLTGQISASNAATVIDTTQITCGSKAVKLEYVSTDPVYTLAPGGYTLNGSIVGPNGAELGYNGVFPGCWNYRAYITLKVRIVPEQPKVQDLVCNSATVTKLGGRSIRVNASAAATNGASINTYTYDLGDGTVKTTSATTLDHTYAKDGNYTVKVSVNGVLNGTNKTVTSQTCMQNVSFGTTTPPVTPPTELPNTGTGSMLAIFAGAMLAGTAAYRLWMIRRLNQ